MQQINKDILKLALPSILANITVPLVGMVDIAVAGHLDTAAATMIGGIAIGTMLFDLLYWNFGFLRVGTGGLAAQAFGRGDMKECIRIFTRAIGISLACAFVLIAIQWIFVKAAFLVVDCTPEVRSLASQYFFIRIWAAPATLSLMAFKGWFIGMQDTVSPMATDLIVNGMNIVSSVVLAMGVGSWEGMGFSGIAAGTVLAQYSGLLTAALIMLLKYRRKVVPALERAEYRDVFRGSETRRFFVMNRDLFIRSLCFIAIYIGFTVISARYGDTLLAVSSIMMKILMIFSYFTDGFAYAGEAMTGKYIGAQNESMLRQTVRWTFIWSMAIAVIFMGIYHFGGVPLLKLMTSDAEVVDASREYLPWLLLMPVVGCAAFTWDGIYIGATAAKAIRNSMLWAVIAFALTWTIGILWLNLFGPVTVPDVNPLSSAPDFGTGLAPAQEELLPSDRYGCMAMHILMAAYFAHLLARTVYLSLKYRKEIRITPNQSGKCAYLLE